ncbi:YraN family protein [Herbiconiux sp. A18JL235]|uniref:UPF0102 protein ABFY20_13735 n=1 Tax=Herbiconiux sp. A18JL235 TaxID=3152363 RepID=A0AB39BCY7_9MICO
MKAKDELGRRGENLAAAHLEQSGYRVVERNWRCHVGEIDIVAYDADCLVVVEVKTRSSPAYGHPFEAITEAKLRRLHLLLRQWVAEREVHRPADARVDVVGIVWPEFGEPHVRHLKAVG